MPCFVDVRDVRDVLVRINKKENWMLFFNDKRNKLKFLKENTCPKKIGHEMVAFERSLKNMILASNIFYVFIFILTMFLLNNEFPISQGVKKLIITVFLIVTVVVMINVEMYKVFYEKYFNLFKEISESKNNKLKEIINNNDYVKRYIDSRLKNTTRKIINNYEYHILNKKIKKL